MDHRSECAPSNCQKPLSLRSPRSSLYSYHLWHGPVSHGREEQPICLHKQDQKKFMFSAIGLFSSSRRKKVGISAIGLFRFFSDVNVFEWLGASDSDPSVQSFLQVRMHFSCLGCLIACGRDRTPQESSSSAYRSRGRRRRRGRATSQ